MKGIRCYRLLNLLLFDPLQTLCQNAQRDAEVFQACFQTRRRVVQLLRADLQTGNRLVPQGF